MNRSKRVIQICILAILSLGTMAAFAADGLAAGVLQPAQVADVAPSAPGDLDRSGGAFLEIFGAPAPEKRSSCMQTAPCSPVGGTPIACTGLTTCTGTSVWVSCDGVQTNCTCNPANLPSCADPEGFCNCWSASPTNGWGVCRQAYCV